RAQAAWTFTGIALNLFTRPLACQKTVDEQLFAERLEACMNNGQLPEFAELGFMVSCPMSIPELPSSAKIVGAAGYRALAAPESPCHQQLQSPLLCLPAECQVEVLRYVDMRSLTALRSTCRQAVKMAGFWRALFLATYEWSPVQSTDWRAYYKTCRSSRNNLRNRGRIQRICRLAVNEFDRWDLPLDNESAANAAAFLRDINYTGP
ncbi:hypothetical protein EC988_010131, partial [Linderina pennispora]